MIQRNGLWLHPEEKKNQSKESPSKRYSNPLVQSNNLRDNTLPIDRLIKPSMKSLRNPSTKAAIGSTKKSSMVQMKTNPLNKTSFPTLIHPTYLKFQATAGSTMISTPLTFLTPNTTASSTRNPPSKISSKSSKTQRTYKHDKCSSR